MSYEAEAGKIGASGAIGGFLGWIISHLKHKEIKELINTRMTKEQCDERHKRVDDWIHESNVRFDRIEEKLDNIKEIILKKGQEVR